MKIVRYISLFLLCLIVFSGDVMASRTYIRGIVKSSSTVKKSCGGENLLSDTNARMTLYSPEAVEIVGEEGDCYQISFMYVGFMYYGYVPKNNVIKKEYKTDDAYETSLINMGFPADYASRLAIIHAIHPNWTFAPSYTGGVTGGMDFYKAVNGEYSVIARNVIDSSNTSLRSTDDGAYKNGEWIQLVGGGNWYGASRQTISFYMDPRNFLDESHIFMFENGGFNAQTQTVEQVNKIIGSTFMKAPFDCLPGANGCTLGTHYYADTFLSAGKDYNVNPNHLASRVVQEQGTNGSVMSFGKGYNGLHIGYYNFFNINATGKTAAEVILNALSYAESKNWNNQHISIYGGASLLGNSYVKRGQANKYYQKFNTIAPDRYGNYYGNQYMQNVRAPYQESYNTYTGYYKFYDTIDNWDIAPYDFLIPIYQNMGGKTSLDTKFNSDATLKNLEVTNCKLNPDFLSSAYNYDCYVKDDINEVEIKAESTNAGAKVTNPSKVILNNKNTLVEVVVTAVNGQTATYSINIHKSVVDNTSPEEILNNVGIKVSENFASNIAVGSDISNIINSVQGKYHFASIKIHEANGNEVTSGIAKTGQIITVTNAGLSKSFKIVLYGDTSGDGLINIVDLLQIQKHLTKSKNLTDEYLKAADISKNGVIDIVDLLQEQKHLVGVTVISQE